MEVIFTEVLKSTRTSKHSIDIGWSTWNADEVSLRNRYDKNGKYSPHASSEIPLGDLQEMMRVVLERLPEVVKAREKKARD
jgi:hypothetical protein